MAKPNISLQNTLHASQAIGPNWNVDLSNETAAEAFGASVPIDVRGVAYIFVYNASGGPCTFGAHPAPGTAGVSLRNQAGTVISVATATAQLVDVRGCHFVTPSAAITVVYTC